MPPPPRTGFGAYVNSQSNDARGVEAVRRSEGRADSNASASYTFLDAVVTKSFSSGVAAARRSTLRFPGIEIGQYAPLVGNRPFRRPANSGSLVLIYADRKAQVVARRILRRQAGRQHVPERSEFFGYSMLLPNQDMDPAYQKFDVSGSYQIHPRAALVSHHRKRVRRDVRAGGRIPALPRAARIGVTVRVGGN